jgi:hypothetical protein
VTRVPRITGFPNITCALVSILSSPTAVDLRGYYRTPHRRPPAPSRRTRMRNSYVFSFRFAEAD